MTNLPLRERIVVERSVAGDDGFGNVAVSWSPLGTFEANVRETTGKEVVAAGRVEASKTATIRVRASSLSRGVTAADRVQARGQIWNIRSVAAVGDGRELIEFLCEAGVA